MRRHERILELIPQGYRTVKALADYFNVSLMTVYRDVRSMEKKGLLVRKHGMLLLKSEVSEEEVASSQGCDFCSKAIDKRLEVVLRLVSGKVLRACCPHCAFMLIKRLEGSEILSCMTWDFVRLNPINFFSARYVINSEAIPCCTPSVIAFFSEQDAFKFQKGFGGQVMGFEEALSEVPRLMTIPVKVNLSGL
ncbi:MAG: DeoR family transcriptional regulator [Aquificaceae bacterium]|nr:DeoR family transcriptional regulator [Aquificaceae bacterium]MDW8237710.1 DeoR family transcriptional regulator [Aquificaceae bacterium]